MPQRDQDGEVVTVIVPAGVLGAGISARHVALGVEAGAQAIAVDAGSTDSGPSCLATGISKMSRDAIKRDLAVLMRAAEPAGLPILVGSCGTAGTNSGVDWTRDIVIEIARENGMKPRIALLYSEQDKDVLHSKLRHGRTRPLPPLGDLTDELIDSCSHIVALMGAEPYIKALQEGADIILGGRTTDTAVLAAFPLLHDAGTAAAWHAGKIAECGGLCTQSPREGGVLLRVGKDFFDVEPLEPTNRCTPHTVSAHMLYENSDPFLLIEPDGILDVRAAKYDALTDRSVRVTGSAHETKNYTMKLEGASGGAFQTLMLIGIEDPLVLSSVDLFIERLHERLTKQVVDTFPGLNDYHLSLRPYGWNAVSGAKNEPGSHVPREIGLLLVVTAPSQDLATRIAKACNPLFFHFPLDKGIPLPSYGFPFSPAEIERGQVYEFKLNHIVEVDDPLELVRMDWVVLDQAENRSVA
jgi:hypothetical protein